MDETNPKRIWLSLLNVLPDYGTIGLVRDTESAVPTMPSGDLLLSWQTYSNNSALALQRRRKPPVQGAV